MHLLLNIIYSALSPTGSALHEMMRPFGSKLRGNASPAQNPLLTYLTHNRIAKLRVFVF